MKRKHNDQFHCFFDTLFAMVSVVIIVGLLILLVWLVRNEFKDSDSKESFRYKQILFFSAAGKEIGISDIEVQDLETDTRWAHNIGKYIRLEYKKGRSLDNILSQWLKVKRTYDKVGHGNLPETEAKRARLSNLLRNKKIAEEMISMSLDWRFWEIADNPEDVKLLKLTLSSKEGKIPILTKKEVVFPWSTFLFRWLIIGQFISYLACLMRREVPSLREWLDYKSLPSYQKILTLSILSPGALPLMIIHPGLTGLVTTCTSRRESSYNFDLKKLASDPSIGSRELLKRLNQRLDKGK